MTTRFLFPLSALCVSLILTGSSLAAAPGSEQVGTLTELTGATEIFSHPSKTPAGPKPHVFYEGSHYSVRMAKVGETMEKGNILRTAPGASARVIFKNGDQFVVGPGTSYKIDWSGSGKDSKTNLNLMHGKIRGIVSKDGPRSRFLIRTRSVTMGVRGTDFFVEESPSAGATHLTVLRGAVEFKPLNSPQAKAVEVKSGYSVESRGTAPKAEATLKETGKAKESAAAPVVKIYRTSQPDLITIQKAAPRTAMVQRALSSEMKKEIEVLEKKAVETALADIKHYDPQLYAKVSKQEVTSAEAINTVVVKENFTQAPAVKPGVTKPLKRDMDRVGEDAYEKYFKIPGQ